MPIVSFDDWAGGLDVRPAASLSKTNILRVLSNAYITTGKSIKKRPCLNHIATLEAGTVGLKSFGGKLNTFYGSVGGVITHADTRFVARRVASPVHPQVSKIHFCDQFNGLMYVAVEYVGGSILHHYLDDPGVWVGTTDYALNDIRRPTVENGFRYLVTTDAGSSGAAEPTWPTTIGGTVVDGGITWTCRSFEITDLNCPHSKQVAKQAQKIFAVGVDATTVRFSATGNPRDWTTASDAGFLPAGLYARGSDRVTALGLFSNSSLAVFFADNAQVWKVDPDPALHVLTSNIEGVGTLYHRAAGPVSQDLFFLAQNGFRSMSLITLTQNLQDTDVGSPVDSVVRSSVSANDDPLSLFYQKLGQFWSINVATVWAYSFSRTSKISAWSKYTLPFTVDDATVLNQELYVRSGNDVYQVSDAVFKDGASSIPLVDVEMFYQDGKAPAVLKQWMGIDIIGEGQWTISHKFQADGQSIETAAAEYPAVTEPGELYPVELMSTRIAPHLTHAKDEPAEISALMLHYEKLGTMGG